MMKNEILQQLGIEGKIDAINNAGQTALDNIGTAKTNATQELEAKQEELLEELGQQGAEFRIQALEKENAEQQEELEMLLKDHKPIPFNGASSHLEDTGELPMPISINGGIEQETREGYNLLQVDETNWELTDKGIKNKSINEAKRLNKVDITLKANTTYYLNFVIFSRPSIDTSFTSYIDNAGKGAVSFSGIQNFEINKTYTITYTPTKDEVFKIVMWGNSNSDTFEFQYWITTDSTKTTYEQYGVSPSIEYPSEVKGVGGHYDITVENKNFNFRPYKDGNGKITNGITFSVNNDGSVVANGTATANAYFYLHTQDATPYLNLEKGTYTISGGINSNCKVIARLYKETTYVAGATDSVNGAILDTTNYDYDRVLLFIEISSGQACNNLIFKPQIEKGKVATDYVENQEQNYALDIPFEMYSGKAYKENGKWYRDVKYKKNIPTTYRILTDNTLNDFILIPKLEDDVTYDTYGHSPNMRSNKAKAKNISYSIDTTNTFGGNGSPKNYMFGVKKGITTEEANEFVNGLYIIYELKTPTVEEITDSTLIAQLEDLQKAYSYKEVTNINSYAESGAELVLSGNALMSNDIRIEALEKNIGTDLVIALDTINGEVI